METGESLERTLAIASEKSAYVLTDAAAYLRLRKRLNLDLILARDQELRVTYRAIPGRSELSAQSRRLHEWLGSESCRTTIQRFQLDGVRPYCVPGQELPKSIRGRLDIEPFPTDSEDQ